MTNNSSISSSSFNISAEVFEDLQMVDGMTASEEDYYRRCLREISASQTITWLFTPMDNATAEQKAAAKDAAVNYTRDGCLHILEFKKNPVGYGDPMDPMFIAAIRAIYM